MFMFISCGTILIHNEMNHWCDCGYTTSTYTYHPVTCVRKSRAPSVLGPREVRNKSEQYHQNSGCIINFASATSLR